MLSRRVIRVIVALAILGCILAGVIVLITSRSEPEETAFVQEQRQFIFDDCMSFFGTAQGEQELPPGQTAEEFCEAQADSVEFDSRFHYVDLGDALLGTSVLLSMLGMLFGATFIGAEWSSGNMGTLLTWEPRRVRVLVSKAVAAFGVTFLLTLALQVVLALTLLPAGMLNGVMEGTNSEWFRSTAGIALRSSLVASIVAVLGASIASIGRNTAAALGVVFAYFAIVESLLRTWKPHWASWFLGDNFGVLLVGDGAEIPEVGHTPFEAGLLIGGYALIVLLAALLFFQRRDVT